MDQLLGRIRVAGDEDAPMRRVAEPHIEVSNFPLAFGKVCKVASVN